MHKLLLTLCLLISISSSAYYDKGEFVVKEVDRLKIITNKSKHSGYRFLTIFAPNENTFAATPSILGKTDAIYISS